MFWGIAHWLLDFYVKETPFANEMLVGAQLDSSAG